MTTAMLRERSFKGMTATSLKNTSLFDMQVILFQNLIYYSLSKLLSENKDMIIERIKCHKPHLRRNGGVLFVF